ncbi:MAG: hypothetical protein ACE5KA_08225, partial [Nitrososphaerales archaeon]
KITLFVKPERLESLKLILEKAGITDLSYFEHKSYSPKGETVWWRGAVPMVQHYTNRVWLEVFVKETQLNKVLHLLARFAGNKEIKGYLSTVEELELEQLIAA